MEPYSPTQRPAIKYFKYETLTGHYFSAVTLLVHLHQLSHQLFFYFCCPPPPLPFNDILFTTIYRFTFLLYYHLSSTRECNEVFRRRIKKHYWKKKIVICADEWTRMQSLKYLQKNASRKIFNNMKVIPVSQNENISFENYAARMYEYRVPIFYPAAWRTWWESTINKYPKYSKRKRYAYLS